MEKDTSNNLNSSLVLFQENSTFYVNDSIIMDNYNSSYGNFTTEVPNITATPTESPMKEFDYLNPVWNVAFSTTVFTGTLGNLIVLWIVLGKNIVHFFLSFLSMQRN